MPKVLLVSTEHCAPCRRAKESLKELKKDIPDIQIEEISLSTPKGQELSLKHSIITSPGIFIDGKLAFQGGVTKNQLKEALSK